MAVYTRVEHAQVEQLIADYDLGPLTAVQEISAGIENTNYFLDTYSQKVGRQRWVLTIFESLSSDELPFFCELTSHLARAGFAVPAPLENADGNSVLRVDGKPGLIVTCLRGAALESPDEQHCRAIAEYLAQMHLALRDFSRTRALVRDGDWMTTQRDMLLNSAISTAELQLLDQSIARYQNEYREQLLACPQGIVHGDLFRDNVLFEGGQVSGVIDFYHACQASLLFDLAVLANDWAWDKDLEDYDYLRLSSIVDAYQAQRPWTTMERELWPRCLEIAALRFWISRLVSYYLPGYQNNSVEGDTAKDPNDMKVILLCAQAM